MKMGTVYIFEGWARPGSNRTRGKNIYCPHFRAPEGGS